MKKLVIGTVAVVLTALVFTTGAYAARLIELPWSNNIYKISSTDERYESTVSVFDDADNKCYIARAPGGMTNNPDSVAISCVKR